MRQPFFLILRILYINPIKEYYSSLNVQPFFFQPKPNAHKAQSGSCSISFPFSSHCVKVFFIPSRIILTFPFS